MHVDVGESLDRVIRTVESRTHGTRDLVKDMYIATMTFLVDKTIVKSEFQTPIDIDTMASEKLLFSGTRSLRFGNNRPFKVIIGDRSKAVKVFRNGGIHVTGLKNGAQLSYILSVVVDTFQPLSDEATTSMSTDEILGYVETGVEMMNWFCKMPYEIDLDRLKALLLEARIPCKYDRSEKSTTNLSLKNFRGDDTSISVARTGTIRLSGKLVETIVRGFYFIVDFLDANKALLSVSAASSSVAAVSNNNNTRKKRKRDNDAEEGDDVAAEEDVDKDLLRKSLGIVVDDDDGDAPRATTRIPPEPEKGKRNPARRRRRTKTEMNDDHDLIRSELDIGDGMKKEDEEEDDDV